MNKDPTLEYVKSMFDFAFGDKANRPKRRYTNRSEPLYEKKKKYAGEYGKGKARKTK